MARLPRLAIAGLPHLISQRAQHQQAMVRDDQDRHAFIGHLREAAAAHAISVHAYGLSEARFDLVVTPVDAQSLSHFMQVLGRRHAHGFNRRHSRAGSLWEGRFRAAPVEPDAWLLTCMRFVEQGSDRLHSSLAHHIGQTAMPWIVDPPAYWMLGNTPFEREASYRTALEQALTPEQVVRIEAALRGGWLLGSSRFAAELPDEPGRALLPRPRGRPRKSHPGI